MPGLVPGIHVFLRGDKDVDGRDEPGHDENNNKSPTLVESPLQRWLKAH
jgi:hypothetical protein